MEKRKAPPVYPGPPETDLYLFNTGEAQRAYLCFGCHYFAGPDAWRFLVWAPNAKAVHVVGDFNGWDKTATPMAPVQGGFWYAWVPGLKNGDIYKYAITGPDGTVRLKADPFAFHSETGPATGSRVWSLEGYTWGDGDFLRRRRETDPARAPLSIYEVHIGSWKIPEGALFPNYRQVADELAEYCRDMGYTHVELLPVSEYPYEGSWGYQVTGYYAPTSRYGTPQDFMYFVDRLHQAGIGVILDWVPAHFPKDAHGLIQFDGTPQFECKEPRMANHPEWGTLIFDYASPQVQSFLISSAMLFYDLYHIDGIRVDAVSSMLYLDYGRKPGEYTPNKDGGNINLDAVAFLQKLNSVLLTNHVGCVTIAEESTAFPLVTYPPSVGGLGFRFKWDMGFMHDTIEYFSMDPYFRRDNHEKITFSMFYAFSEHFILAYSHDEVVHGKCSMLEKMYGLYHDKFASLRALYGYQFGHPGKKLMFMGSEFAQVIEWNYKQSLDWVLLDYPIHDGMRAWVRELNRLYRENPALYAIEDSWDGFTWLNVDDRDRSSVAFLRMDGKGNYIVCACNFTPSTWESFTIALPGQGKLLRLLSSDEARFGGNALACTARPRVYSRPFRDMPCSAQLFLPPLSVQFYRYTPSPPRQRKTDGKPACARAKGSAQEAGNAAPVKGKAVKKES